MLLLPNELLVAIFQFLPVPDVFQLALTNRRLHAIAREYEKSIAPCAARVSFPDATLLTRAGPGTTQDFEWLKGLVPKYIATVLVDRLRLMAPQTYIGEYGIPAEDEDGEVLRGLVVEGLCVLNRLSIISKEVYKLPDSDVPQPRTSLRERVRRLLRHGKLRRSKPRPHEMLHRREDLIRDRRRRYLEGLPIQSLEAYHLMFAFLIQPIQTHYDLHTADLSNYFGPDGRDPTGLESFDRADDHAKRLFQGNSWLNWYILHEGPLLFWKQWYYCNDRNLIRDRALAAWYARAGEQVWIERDAVFDLRDIISHPIRYECMFKLCGQPALINHRRKKLEGRYKRPQEVLNDVPYWINFRDYRERHNLQGFP
ncbi:hypothetical protein SLS62_010665 [Diatrype stigma]|uniref:F-box domain-containing protein n=1 Tax=Diatrype stigma TaxID=117547 RepID=A0AAN9YHT1_9PEZI